MFTQLSPTDTAVLARVRDEFFATSVIGIDTTKHDTQWLDERGRLMFGVWAGPAARVSNLLHEMAHFVEIDERRMGKRGWGLRLPKMHYIPGPYGGSTWCEPTTMQITAREIRVIAYQHHLHVHLGIEPWRKLLPDLLPFLPDWYNVPGRRDGSRQRWVWSLYDRLIASPRYSLAAFQAEWARRNDLLRAKYIRAGKLRRAMTTAA